MQAPNTKDSKAVATRSRSQSSIDETQAINGNASNASNSQSQPRINASLLRSASGSKSATAISSLVPDIKDMKPLKDTVQTSPKKEHPTENDSPRSRHNAGRKSADISALIRNYDVQNLMRNNNKPANESPNDVLQTRKQRTKSLHFPRSVDMNAVIAALEDEMTKDPTKDFGLRPLPQFSASLSNLNTLVQSTPRKPQDNNNNAAPLVNSSTAPASVPSQSSKKSPNSSSTNLPAKPKYRSSEEEEKRPSSPRNITKFHLRFSEQTKHEESYNRSRFSAELKQELSPLDPRIQVYTRSEENDKHKKKKQRETWRMENDTENEALQKHEQIASTFAEVSILVEIQNPKEVNGHSVVTIDEKLGDRVYKGSYTISNSTVPIAIKKFKDASSQNFEANVEQLRKACDHPYITYCVGGSTNPPSVMMEFAGSSLYYILHKKKIKLDILLALKFGKQIAIAMNFIHKHGLVYKNVLVDDQRNIHVNGFKLIDESQMFNIKSKKKKENNSNSASIASDDVRFRPPEVTKAQQVILLMMEHADFKECTEKVDVYAYGLLLCELFSGKLPFHKLDSVTAAAKAAYENLRPKIPHSLPIILKKLINTCWSAADSERPSFHEVLKFYKHLEGKLFFSSLGGFWSLDKEQELLRERKRLEKFDEVLAFLKERDFSIKYEELKLGEKIGEGSYSKVWEGEWAGYRVAVKKLKNKNITEKFFLREISSLSSLHHPNVVCFFGACVSPPCIVTEYMAGGSLYDVLHVQRVKIELPMVIKMAIDIAKGMVHFHSKNILHRDLTSKNILLDEFQNLKISDFGLSREVKEFGKDLTLAGICNPRWRPPELTKGENQYSGAVDVYCFSLVVYEMLTGKIPFEQYDSVTAAAKAAYEGYRPPLPEDCPEKLKNLITKCWSQEAENRPNFVEILKVLEELQKGLDM